MATSAAHETLSLLDDPSIAAEGRIPYLFLALEAYNPVATPLRIALHEVDEIVVGRGVERRCEVVRDAGVRRVLLRLADPWLSTAHARFTRDGDGAWSFQDTGSKNGSFFLGKRIDAADLDDGAIVELGHTFFLFREAQATAPGAPSPICAPGQAVVAPTRVDLATLSPAFAARLSEVSRIAQRDVPIVIEGETGTGKEVAARALHAASGRAGELVAVNCGALPPTLIEAELFGAKKGAFSGANEDRLGLVRAAAGGTLLLDEVGELPPPAQAALLRVLQEREVLPIGATKPVPVDVRILAATHRPLDRMVEAGTFRRDLMMRLAGFRLRLPPLRERLEDLGLLTGALLARHCEGKVPTIAPKAARALFRFAWPGNVRQLERSLVAAAALAGKSEIVLAHLPEEVRSAAQELPGVRDEEDAVQREELLVALKEHRGNVSAVARALGKARMQVQRWMKRFAFTPEQFK